MPTDQGPADDSAGPEQVTFTVMPWKSSSSACQLEQHQLCSNQDVFGHLKAERP